MNPYLLTSVMVAFTAAYVYWELFIRAAEPDEITEVLTVPASEPAAPPPVEQQDANVIPLKKAA